MEDVRVFKNGELFKAFDVEHIKRAHMLAKLIQADGDLVRVEWDSPDGLMYMVRRNRWVAAYTELPVRVKRAPGRPKSDSPVGYVPTGNPRGRPRSANPKPRYQPTGRPPGRPKSDNPRPRYAPTGNPRGRPKSNEVRKLKSIMLTDVEIAKAQAAGNGNLSAGIRKAIGLLD